MAASIEEALRLGFDPVKVGRCCLGGKGEGAGDLWAGERKPWGGGNIVVAGF